MAPFKFDDHPAVEVVRLAIQSVFAGERTYGKPLDLALAERIVRDLRTKGMLELDPPRKHAARVTDVPMDPPRPYEDGD